MPLPIIFYTETLSSAPKPRSRGQEPCLDAALHLCHHGHCFCANPRHIVLEPHTINVACAACSLPGPDAAVSQHRQQCCVQLPTNVISGAPNPQLRPRAPNTHLGHGLVNKPG